MIIVLKDNPDQKQLENLVSWLKSMGLDIHMSKGQSATIMGLIGDTAAVDIDLINALDRRNRKACSGALQECKP